MENILEYNQWNNQGIKWSIGGWLLIKGKKNKEGKCNIFAAQVKSVNELSRYKVGGKEGIPVNMATLYPEFYGIVKDEEGNMKSKKLPYDPTYIEKWTSIKNLKIGLNKNKTINWRETIKETSLNKAIKNSEYFLKNSPDIIIPVR